MATERESLAEKRGARGGGRGGGEWQGAAPQEEEEEVEGLKLPGV